MISGLLPKLQNPCCGSGVRDPTLYDLEPSCVTPLSRGCSSVKWMIDSISQVHFKNEMRRV